MEYKIKQEKIILLGLILLLITGVIAQSSLKKEFDPKNIDTWASSKENIEKFEKMSDSDKTSAWNNAKPEQKDKFLYEYKKSKGISADLKNLNHKDLSWRGTKLVSVPGILSFRGSPSFDFNDARDSLKSVTYDDKNKAMVYSFEKGDIKNKISIDDGFINKDGDLIKQTSDKNKFVDEKIAQVTSGNGDMSYKKGQIIIPKDSERGVFIGTSYYENFKKTDETIITPRKDGGVDVFNARISLIDKPDAQAISAVLTTTDERKNGVPRTVAFFDRKAVPSDVASSIPYAAIDVEKGTITMNDNSKVTKTATFMQTEIYKNFDSIHGSGEQVWVKNGNAQFDFKGGNILFVDNMKRGVYDIGTVSNLDVVESAKNAFTFKSYGQGYADFYSKESTLVDSGALVSETSGMYVNGPRGRILGGSSETGYSNIRYDEKYNMGVFQGTEEERLAAIARDPNTFVEVHGTPSVSIPGQYFASEVLSNLDYSMAIAALDMYNEDLANLRKTNPNAEIKQSPAEYLESQMGQLKSFVISNRDLTDSIQRDIVAESLITGKPPRDSLYSYTSFQKAGLKDRYPELNDFKLRQKAEQLIDAYIISSNYESNHDQLDMSNVNPEKLDELKSVNRLLYEASVNYQGSVNIPDSVKEARKSGGPSSDGGISTIQLQGDGIYVDGQKIPGVKPEVASALRNLMAGQLLNFDSKVAERRSQVAKYGTRINQAGYAFDINDYKQEAHTSNVYYSGIIGARAVGQSALNAGHAQLDAKESRYQYYQSVKRLP